MSMTDAPKRIWAWGLDGNVGHATRIERIGDVGYSQEYHLAQPGQPMSTDYFIDKVLLSKGLDMEAKLNRIIWWRCGNFTAAMEGLE